MTAITKCRSCESTKLASVLSLGETPLANALVEPENRGKPEARYPLEVVLCEACSLLQITETVPPEVMFRAYPYFSSFSDTLVRHAHDTATRMAERQHLGPTSLAAEIASNDGYLLKSYVARGIPVLGIEPARNVAAAAEKNGVRTIAEFFGADLAKKLVAEGHRADIIHANNVMAHVPDIRGVLEGVRTFLKDDGVFSTESPYVKPMLDHCEFDTIYHEHLFYWSVTALSDVSRRMGLTIVDAEPISIHGGSLRVLMQRTEVAKPEPSVERFLAEEASWGVRDPRSYRQFADRVGGLRSELRATLEELKRQGKSIAAYGAAAKGSTLLNTAGIGAELLDFVVDRNIHKQGRFMPGVGLPILPPEALLERKPDYCVVLSWNFKDEVIAQQQAYRDAGGKFIVPVPKVQIV